MHVTLSLANLLSFFAVVLFWTISMENEKVQLFLSLEKRLVIPEDLYTTWQQGKIGYIHERKAQAEKAINLK